MTYPLPMWDIPTVPIAGSNDRFPVRHIYYAGHAKEMAGDAAIGKRGAQGDGHVDGLSPLAINIE